MANTPAASPTVSSTVGLKNMVIAPLTVDTEETLTYGDLQLVAGAIEASITPENADPDIQYADDIEFDVLYPDPELTFTTKMADIPLAIQEKIFGNRIDDNGVLVRTAQDQPPSVLRRGLQERKVQPQVPLCVAIQGTGKAPDRELRHQGRHHHHPPDGRRGMDCHQAHQ